MTTARAIESARSTNARTKLEIMHGPDMRALFLIRSFIVIALACATARGRVISPHAVSAFATTPSQATTPSPNDIDQRIARLDAGDASSAEDEMRALAAAGETAANAALRGFKDASILGRRRRAWLVREAGAAACIDGAIENLADPDPLTRATLIEFLGRIELLQNALEARIDALTARALGDDEASLRLAASTALSQIGEPAAIDRLDQLLDRLAEPDLTHAARMLAQSPRGASQVRRRVLEACAANGADAKSESERASNATSTPRASVLRGEPLAALLASYGRSLADLPSGGETKAERAPLVFFARDPDPRVKSAAAIAFDTMLRRLALRGEVERIDRILAGLEEQGFDARFVLYQRARLELTVGADPSVAVAKARELERVAAVDDGRDARAWRARALSVEACALIAADALEEAREPIARAAEILDALAAERVDLVGKGLVSEELQGLHERALCDLASAVRRIAVECRAEPQAKDVELGAEAERDVAAIVHHMHTLELEAELAAWRGDIGSNGSLDPLLEAEQSPLVLVLENPRMRAWPASRALRVRELFGRALKSVAPSEAPGFEPFPGLPDEIGDPSKDPERRALLQRLQYARLDALSKELNEIFERLARRGVTDTAQLSPSEERRIRELRYEMDRTVASVQAGAKNADAKSHARDLEELRVPAWYALNLARELRDDGQPARARSVAKAMLSDIDRDGSAQKYLWGLELQAEIEMTIGTSYTDDGDPKQAEVELVKAVERLEELEKLVKEREFGPAALARLQSLRCSALVSLAVNANVKQGDTAKAVAYFERAWALRQDDSMRVLLACYRARQGRSAESRTLLRSVTPTPIVNYNLACTWALLGEKDLALEFLKREFQDGQLSAGGAAKQREWARQDPDLKSLRGDPRFQEIVGP
jgi:hypothetical protein